ncbi:MAG: acetoacetate--CoA ligase [Thermoplasmatales archaeon]|nr:acetoacetate--CoA ligase [Candidatus Thermoplasmatota archaeon]MCL6002818.1 acetoacetate--CoA ligase [Candidatus Thermoplasmatota archaeon]MDA8056054.1 acetoacetate--CoA ligase [Thermoplasmatales archaeon]
MTQKNILWEPKEFCEKSNIRKFTEWVNAKYSKNFKEYEDLRRWSIESTSDFWESILLYFEVKSEGGYQEVLNSERMPGNRWFQGLRLNYAENNLSLGSQEELLLFFNETDEKKKVSRNEFENHAGAVQKFLIDSGVKEGDRVASFLPNVPEAMEALYATSAIGAVWSSSSPDFGSEAILERFKQINPKILFAPDGYTYNGKKYGKTDIIKQVTNKIPSIRRVVILGEEQRGIRDSVSIDSILKNKRDLSFNRVPFDHPLWILYSSGTTGPPKAIVHSQGGILLEHLKLLGLHYNLNKGDKFFWFTTTGWMMWNVLVSSISTGATAVLYDGNVTYPDNYHLWTIAEDNGISFFGTSAAYITHLMKEKIRVNDRYPLEKLFAIGSTGSPLSNEAFRFVYDNIKKDVWLASISGGTDLCTAFLGGCACLPVIEGELQCRDLGADIHAFDEDGKSVLDQVGELVIKKPMPSMPIYLWNDNGEKMFETYFSRYPGIWRHGDWLSITPYGSAVIVGRSDSTLKRKGIRIGTAEIYGVLDEIDEVKDSIIVGLEMEGGEYYMPLFVVTDSTEDFDRVKKKIVEKLKVGLSPRHVPDDIIRVSQIPRTINGKKMEVPLKKLLMGFPTDKALNIGSMANPESLKEFQEIAKNIRKDKN